MKDSNSEQQEQEQEQEASIGTSPLETPVIEREASQVSETYAFEDEDDDDDIEIEDEDYENEQDYQDEQDTTKIPIDEGLSSLSSDFLIKILNKILPNVAHSLSSFNTKDARKLEATGKLASGSTAVFEEINAKNLAEFQSTVAMVTPFLEEPLEKLAVKKNIKLEPETVLLVVGIGLMLYLGYQTYKIGKSNKELVAELMAMHQQEKEIQVIDVPIVASQNQEKEDEKVTTDTKVEKDE